MSKQTDIRQIKKILNERRDRRLDLPLVIACLEDDPEWYTTGNVFERKEPIDMATMPEDWQKRVIRVRIRSV